VGAPRGGGINLYCALARFVGGTVSYLYSYARKPSRVGQAKYSAGVVYSAHTKVGGGEWCVCVCVDDRGQGTVLSRVLEGGRMLGGVQGKAVTGMEMCVSAELRWTNERTQLNIEITKSWGPFDFQKGWSRERGFSARPISSN